jgi:hypothetical protein
MLCYQFLKNYAFMSFTRYRKKLALLIVGLLLLSGCQLSHHQELLLPALPKTLAKPITKRSHFNHTVEEKLVDTQSTLTVFIEGDGRPWLNNTAIAKDPTPHALLAYALFREINTNSIYLGRPCYFQTVDSRCDFRYWTSHRYSHDVIDSMIAVVNEYLQKNHYSSVTLVGYSGGGVIATMMACGINAKTLLYTLSANLSVNDWTQLHHYAALEGSQDPYLHFEPCNLVAAKHFVGSADDNVPSYITEKFTQKFGHDLVLVESADHANWLRFWNHGALLLTEPNL